MPFRIFLIPVLYGDDATQELNAFIASHRVALIERRWIEQGNQSAWAFCVEYVLASPTLPGQPRSQLSRNRIDYKTILSPDEFTIFSLLRELRKELSQQEGVPVFALFSNEQLAQMVQRRCSSKADLLGIEGIGEAKVDKYAQRLLPTLAKLKPSPPETESP
jgi:superfamily II DNA helicase RecQ